MAGPGMFAGALLLGDPTILAIPLSQRGSDAGPAVTDLDQDGDWDLVLPTARSLYLFEQSGPFSFTSRPEWMPAGNLVGVQTRGVTAGDLDHDGVVELALWNDDGFTVLDNVPSETGWDRLVLEERDDLNLEAGGIVDLDGDGQLELFLHHNRSDDDKADASVLVRYGALGWSVVNSGPIAGDGIEGEADYGLLGDLTGNGAPDFIVRTNRDDPSVHLNDGAGTLVPQPDGLRLTSDFGNKAGMALCDVDIDGDLDLMWTDVPPQLEADGFVQGLWANDGAGDFSLLAPLLTGERSLSASCGDLDHDGQLEILIPGRSDIARFSPQGGDWIQESLIPRAVVSTTLADLDDDGDLDIIGVAGRAADAFALSFAIPNEIAADQRRAHLQLHVRHAVGSCEAGDRVVRDDVGAQASLGREDGTFYGLREVLALDGLGNPGWPVMHWGGIEPGREHVLDVRFRATGAVVRLPVIPDDLGPELHRLVITSDDADGDGILDADEAAFGDLDGDGWPSEVDPDSDGDGISDRDEAGDADVCTELPDADGDGIPDPFDAEDTPPPDTDAPPDTDDPVGPPDPSDPVLDGVFRGSGLSCETGGLRAAVGWVSLAALLLLRRRRRTARALEVGSRP